MYESFFNLKIKPFELLPDPRFFYLSKSHRKAQTYLDYGIRERAGFILLTGEVGSGKTTLIRDLLEKKFDHVVLSKIFNTRVTSEQLLTMINEDFGLAVAGKDKVTLIRELNEFLIEQYAAGTQSALIIDEAQNLSLELLEEVRMLSNLEASTGKLLQIILVGQPELRSILAVPEMRQLRQRISINCHLQALDADEVGQYILKRLEVAGNISAVQFNDHALAAIYRHSHGIPRLINIICDFILFLACTDSVTEIGLDLVNDVVKDLDFEKYHWAETCDSVVAAETDRIPLTPAGTVVPSSDFLDTFNDLSIRLDRLERSTANVQIPPDTSGLEEQVTALAERLKKQLDHNTLSLNTVTGRVDDLSRRFAALESATVNKGERSGLFSRLTALVTPSGARGKVKKLVIAMFYAAGCSAVLPTLSIAAETLLAPYISLRQEATDNIFEQKANRKSEFTTLVSPGVAYKYVSPLWSWDIGYAMIYRIYANGSRGNEFTQDAAAKGKISIVDNFLFLDVSDTYHRVSLDASRDVANASSSFINQSDQNVLSLSPYIVWRLRGDSAVKIGYRFTDTSYKESSGIDKREHRGFVDLSHDLSARMNMSAGFQVARLESVANRLNYQDIYGGFRYEYADKSFLIGQLGNSWQQYDAGSDASDLFWTLAINRDMGLTTASLETKVSKTEDPQALTTRQTSYGGKLERKLTRGLLGFTATYSEYENKTPVIANRNSLTVALNGRHELKENLSSNMSATGERFSRTTDGYPYRFTGMAGINYLLSEKLTCGFTYTYTFADTRVSTTGAYQVNKAVLEVKQSF